MLNVAVGYNMNIKKESILVFSSINNKRSYKAKWRTCLVYKKKRVTGSYGTRIQSNLSVL